MSFTWLIAGLIAAPVAAIMVHVTFSLLSGRINTIGMLGGKETGTLTVGRLQMLLAVVGAGLLYVAQLVGGLGGSNGLVSLYVLPDPSDWIEGAMGASGGAYLVAKFLPGSFGRARNPAPPMK